MIMGESVSPSLPSFAILSSATLWWLSLLQSTSIMMIFSVNVRVIKYSVTNHFPALVVSSYRLWPPRSQFMTASVTVYDRLGHRLWPPRSQFTINFEVYEWVITIRIYELFINPGDDELWPSPSQETLSWESGLRLRCRKLP